MPVIVAVPAVVPVYVTEHEPLASVHDAPIVPIDAVNVTVPVGVSGVPAALVSATVAMHVVAWLIATVLGEHDTVVDDVLRDTVTVAVPVLPVCTESPL